MHSEKRGGWRRASNREKDEAHVRSAVFRNQRGWLLPLCLLTEDRHETPKKQPHCRIFFTGIGMAFRRSKKDNRLKRSLVQGDKIPSRGVAPPNFTSAPCNSRVADLAGEGEAEFTERYLDPSRDRLSCRLDS